jgi:hypothetical protein
MTYLVRDVLNSLRASPIFAFYLLATLVIAGRVGLITFNVIDMGMTHFGVPEHRVHDLTFGFVFTTGVVGILVQLRRPAANVAGMLMALIPWVALLLAAVFSADVVGVLLTNPSSLIAPVAVVAALLHPTGRRFFRSFSVSRVDRVMLALVIIAAVPLLVFASTNIGLQATITDEHAGMGHYGFMAAFSFTVIGVGLLASVRPDGWRLTAWVAGLLLALLGCASLLYPVSSSLSQPWALAAIAWGVGFVAAAERSRGTDAQMQSNARRVESRAARG